ncbi:MAG: hypothetical protein H0Z28_13475 [Archaeoglobus sp.]|nr:hypothetical protein [Archaeoglobus sp.]
MAVQICSDFPWVVWYAWISTTIEMSKINYESVLPTIKVPTLILVAEFDITTPPEIGKQIFKAY